MDSNNIEQVLKSMKDSENYQEKIALIENYCVSALPNIKKEFEQYTDHGASHSRFIISFLGDFLVGLEGSDKLNEIEMFLLCAGAWTHDLGMIRQKDEKISLIQIRDNHHLRSANIIEKKHKEWKLTEEEKDALIKIVLSHRSSKSFDIEEIPDEIELHSKKIRLKFLCSCFRIADECHITYDRAIELIETRGDLDEKSKKHILSHYQTKEINFSKEREVILISVIINSILVDNFMQDYIEKLRGEIEELIGILRKNGLSIITAHLRQEITETYEIERSEKYLEVLLWILEKNPENLEFPTHTEYFTENQIKSTIEILDFKHESVIKRLVHNRVKLDLTNGNFLFLVVEFLNSKKHIYSFLKQSYFQDNISDLLKQTLTGKWLFSEDEFKEDFTDINQKSSLFPSVLKYSLEPDQEDISLGYIKYKSQINRYMIEDLFEIHRNLAAHEKDIQGFSIEYKVKVASSLKTHISTRIVIPMILMKTKSPIEIGDPVKLTDEKYVLNLCTLYRNLGSRVAAFKILDIIKDNEELRISYLTNKSLILLSSHSEVLEEKIRYTNELDVLEKMFTDIKQEIEVCLKNEKYSYSLEINYFNILTRMLKFKEAGSFLNKMIERYPENKELYEIKIQNQELM